MKIQYPVYEAGRRLAAALFLAATGMSCLHAQNEGRIRLHAISNYPDITLPFPAYVIHFEGFSTDGTNIAFIYKPGEKGEKQETSVHWFNPLNEGMQSISSAQLQKNGLFSVLTDGYDYSIDPQRKEYASIQYDELFYCRDGRVWKQPNNTGISVENMHINAQARMVYGTVCYPYGDYAQGINSGMYRWMPETGAIDSLSVPRKHLYIAHLQTDNAWSALLSDSLCAMADITSYRLWLAGSHGEAREMKLHQPQGWVQYPDSLENHYAALSLLKGQLAAWDTVKSWFNHYSRIEKVMANGKGDVLLRYNALDASGMMAKYFDLYRYQGDSLVYEKTLVIHEWDETAKAVTKENFSSTFLDDGVPTFFLNDRSLVAIGAEPKGKSYLRLRSKADAAAFHLAMMTKPLRMVAYVYRFD
jgi:hypothetical protein